MGQAGIAADARRNEKYRGGRVSPPVPMPVVQRMRRRLLAVFVLAWAGAATASDRYVPGTADDPRVRSANFLGAEQRYYSAISELLQIDAGGGEGREGPSEYRSRLADFQLSLGMHDRAQAAYRAAPAPAPATEPDPLIAARAGLRLAKFEYQRGYLDEARSSLLRAREKLPHKLEAEWADLYARVLMAMGRYNEAVAVLDAIDVREDPNGFLRYNLGIALIADGRGAEGRALLDRVGRLEGRDTLTAALRDKANVTLGWHLLQQQLGGAARPLLLRVRSQGPYTNRALLGLGWAELSPEGRGESRADLGIEPVTGSRLRNDVTDPLSGLSPLGVLMRNAPLENPEDRRGRGILLRGSPGNEEEDGLRRALIPWGELLDRNPDDPSVHEVWLAVPFALDRLGARVQALQYYEQAARRLEAARRRIASAIEAIKGGRMAETMAEAEDDAEAGWTWEVRVLPEAPETYFLQTLIAEHPFAEGLKNYRDLRMMGRSLESWRSRLGKMEQVVDASAGVPADAQSLVALARRNWKAPREKRRLHLIEESRLSAPGRYSQAIGQEQVIEASLRLSDLPSRFEGSRERLQGLGKRLDALARLLDDARAESARQLRKQALDELDAQKSRIDRYRAEAHFALARLHDRAAPVPDQDEQDVK